MIENFPKGIKKKSKAQKVLLKPSRQRNEKSRSHIIKLTTRARVGAQWKGV